MKLALHIGMNKTGSSALQGVLNSNPEKLAERGILFPEVGIREGAHHQISFDAREAHAQNAEAGFLAKYRFFQDDLPEGIDTVVVSSEDLFTHADPSIFARLFSKFDVQVVIYLREYASHLRSWYQQDLQASWYCGHFDTYASLVFRPYSVVLDRWTNVFGRDAVTARIYDRAQLKDGDLAEDFFSVIGLGSTENLERVPWDPNPSISGNLLFVKRLINLICTKDECASITEDLWRLSALDDSFSGAIPLDADMIDHIEYITWNDVHRLQTQYGIFLPVNRNQKPAPAFPDTETLASDFRRIKEKAESDGLNIAPLLSRVETCFGALGG